MTLLILPTHKTSLCVLFLGVIEVIIKKIYGLSLSLPHFLGRDLWSFIVPGPRKIVSYCAHIPARPYTSGARGAVMGSLCPWKMKSAARISKKNRPEEKVTMNRSNIPHQGLEGGLYIVYIYGFFWEIWFLGIPLFWIMYKGPQMVDSRWGWLWILCRLSSELCDGHSVCPWGNQTCSAENRQCYTLLMLPELEGQLLWSMQYLGCVLLWCLDLMLNTKLFHTYTNIHVHNI